MGGIAPFPGVRIGLRDLGGDDSVINVFAITVSAELNVQWSPYRFRSYSFSSGDTFFLTGQLPR